MKKFLCAILFLTMVISLSACGGKGVSTLVKHYGQEKVDEMEIECTDETQLKVANDLIAEAKDIMSYCGSGDGTNKEDCGALERYYFFDDETVQAIMNEALKYNGWEYVFGGSSPTTSFDCSGLTQWCFGKAGISLPRTAQAQYDATQHIPIAQAKPGDLVFFHSTYNAGSYVTHVGIYVSPTQMYHAGSSGIGYTDLTSSYWQQHLIGAGRVKQ